MHILNDPSFFLTNKTEAPQGEELGLMNPLLESSCNCSDNSFILDGANRYDARAMGTAPRIKSIWNSTGRAGGRPGKSREILLENSRTIVRPLSVSLSDFSSSLLVDICAKRPGIPWPYGAMLIKSQLHIPILLVPFTLHPLSSVLGQSLLKCPGAPTQKQPFPLGVATIALHVSVCKHLCSSIPAITSKVPYFVALVAPLGARAIVVEMALVALGQGSPIRLPFAYPHVVYFGDILPLKGCCW
ncbi:hypothetical protein Tco_0420727 [Tanacetum coccineum]